MLPPPFRSLTLPTTLLTRLCHTTLSHPTHSYIIQLPSTLTFHSTSLHSLNTFAFSSFIATHLRKERIKNRPVRRARTRHRSPLGGHALSSPGLNIPITHSTTYSHICPRRSQPRSPRPAAPPLLLSRLQLGIYPFHCLHLYTVSFPSPIKGGQERVSADAATLSFPPFPLPPPPTRPSSLSPSASVLDPRSTIPSPAHFYRHQSRDISDYPCITSHHCPYTDYCDSASLARYC